jgi:hypothetical protein
MNNLTRYSQQSYKVSNFILIFKWRSEMRHLSQGPPAHVGESGYEIFTLILHQVGGGGGRQKGAGSQAQVRVPHP